MKCLRTQLEYDKFSKFTSEIVCHCLCIASMYPFLLVWLLINTHCHEIFHLFQLYDRYFNKSPKKHSTMLSFHQFIIHDYGVGCFMPDHFYCNYFNYSGPVQRTCRKSMTKKEKKNILYWCFRERIFKDFQISQLFK